ncbi:hypothetical protein WQ54_22645 [Bacillus sp. SA1-12]|uniref:hypothetical protein n=1 Tax=Bacillus sp. SA1-12 TaxID=1455638 RepID=UPI000627240C|nr:hypothetical protein [Bacillus sp. SA1-12]KKI89943.1 hypothetical protein WQ54_22645 [Bacillus sp. SA1-12]
MKLLFRSKQLFRRDHQDHSWLFFFIFVILLIGYTIDFLIYKDWSFLYVTIAVPLILGCIYRWKSKGKGKKSLPFLE